MVTCQHDFLLSRQSVLQPVDGVGNVDDGDKTEDSWIHFYYFLPPEDDDLLSLPPDWW